MFLLFSFSFVTLLISITLLVRSFALLWTSILCVFSLIIGWCHLWYPTMDEYLTHCFLLSIIVPLFTKIVLSIFLHSYWCFRYLFITFFSIFLLMLRDTMTLLIALSLFTLQTFVLLKYDFFFCCCCCCFCCFFCDNSILLRNPQVMGKSFLQCRANLLLHMFAYFDDTIRRSTSCFTSSKVTLVEIHGQSNGCLLSLRLSFGEKMSH